MFKVNFKLYKSLVIIAFAIAMVVTSSLIGGNIASAAAGTSYYVSLTGNDANNGGISSPFKTIERARDAIRTLKSGSGLPAGGVDVFLRGGKYPISNSFALTSQDSGTVSSPITYKAYDNEAVSFVGGITMDAGSFTQVTDTTTLNRLLPSAQGNVVKYALPAD